MKKVSLIIIALVIITGLVGQPVDKVDALVQPDPSQAWVSLFAEEPDIFSLATSISLDESENIYVTGSSTGLWGTPIRDHYGSDDVFVAKFDKNKNLIWNTFLGGIGSDLGSGISLDASGNIYVSGVGTANWEPQPDLVPLGGHSGHPYSAFIAKLDENGNLLWYTFPLGGYNTFATAIATDGNGNVYMGGSSVDTVGADRVGLLIKMNGAGVYQWGVDLGIGTVGEIALDGDGNIFTAGESSASWGASPIRPYAGQHDIFVAKLNGSGTLQWNTFLGGSEDDLGMSVALDKDQNLYVGGRSYGSWGSPLQSYHGQDDAVLGKLDQNGNLIWHTFLGNANSDEGWEVTVDDNQVYFCGTSASSWGVPVWPHDGGDDAMVASLDGSGNLLWHGYLGNGGDDECLTIETLGNGSIYFGGFIASPVTESAFVAKLVIQTQTFTDVPLNHPYFEDIGILYANGLTGGCSTSPLMFCPDDIMNRAQSAVFMVRGMLGAGYTPAPPVHKLGDNWTLGTWAEPWAEAIIDENLSTGCSTSPFLYCPWEKLPREQVVIFGLRMKYGVNYQPTAATGTLFADMTDPNYYATRWAEKAYIDGLLPACGTSGGKPLFCPRDLVSRGLGAYVIVRAKNLSMP